MRRLLTLLPIVGLLSATGAAAASLNGLSGAGLGAAAAVVARCDPDGVAESYTTSGGKVTTVTISGIAPACDGGRIAVTLTEAGAGVASGGPVTIGAGGTIAIPVSPLTDAERTDAIHIMITGP